MRVGDWSQTQERPGPVREQPSDQAEGARLPASSMRPWLTSSLMASRVLIGVGPLRPPAASASWGNTSRSRRGRPGGHAPPDTGTAPAVPVEVIEGMPISDRNRVKVLMVTVTCVAEWPSRLPEAFVSCSANRGQAPHCWQLPPVLRSGPGRGNYPLELRERARCPGARDVGNPRRKSLTAKALPFTKPMQSHRSSRRGRDRLDRPRSLARVRYCPS